MQTCNNTTIENLLPNKNITKKEKIKKPTLIITLTSNTNFFFVYKEKRRK